MGDLTKRRSRAEAELAKAKSAHERTLKNLIYGHITTESWLAVRPELKRNIALSEAGLARTEAPPKINLHSAAVANHKSALDNLHDVMCHDTEDCQRGVLQALGILLMRSSSILLRQERQSGWRFTRNSALSLARAARLWWLRGRDWVNLHMKTYSEEQTRHLSDVGGSCPAHRFCKDRRNM